MKHMNLRCKAFMVLLIVLFTVSVLCGCARILPSAKAASDPVPKLQLTVTPGESSVNLTPEDLGNNYDGDINYSGLSEVNIRLGDKNLPLADAIKNGEVTVEELTAWARIDARYNLCTETFESKNGLSQFYYAYPDFELALTYDVYETPDGESHLIKRFSVCSPGTEHEPLRFMPPEEDRHTTDPIDKEDWGLSFTMKEATPTGVKIQCTQKEGQQLGTLKVWAATVYNKTGTIAQSITAPGENLDIQLNMNGDTELTMDWTKNIVELPQGDYAIRLYIEDVYEETAVNPLTRNFYDKQTYDVDFTVK